MLAQLDQYLTPRLANGILLTSLVLLLLLGLENQFIQDDAFISFRYAENWLEGKGLTWNAEDKPPVEGYTNFLWVVLMAGGMLLGVAPDIWSMGVGMLCGAGTLFLTYRLALLLLASRAAALLTVLLLGTNYSFSSYMTGGLETQLQALLFAGMTLAAFWIFKTRRAGKPLALAGVSCLFALALMTRLDSALICAVLYPFLAYAAVQQRESSAGALSAIAALTLPAALLVGAWFAFKLAYYGDILPVTFYAKTSGLSVGVALRGLWYLWQFLVDYALILFVCLMVLYAPRVLNRVEMRVLLGAVAIWCAYTMRVGGDFMEYRFFVPILPLFFVAVVRTLQVIEPARLQAALILLLLCFSLHHGLTYTPYWGIESIDSLNLEHRPVDEDWPGMG